MTPTIIFSLILTSAIHQQDPPKPFFAFVSPTEAEILNIKAQEPEFDRKAFEAVPENSGYWVEDKEFSLFISSGVLPLRELEEYVTTLENLAISAQTGKIPLEANAYALNLIRKNSLYNTFEVPADGPFSRIDLSFAFRAKDPALKPDVFSYPEPPIGFSRAIATNYDLKDQNDIALFNEHSKNRKKPVSFRPSPFTLFDPNKMLSPEKVDLYAQISRQYAKQCELYSQQLAKLAGISSSMQRDLIRRLCPQLLGKDLKDIAYDDLPPEVQDSMRYCLARQFGGDANNPALLAYLSNNPHFKMLPVLTLNVFTTQNGQNTGFGFDLPTGN